jgi:hypothetical protein
MIQKNAPQIPVKWLVVIVFALVAYGLGQPVANRQLGWNLPSLASLLGNKDAVLAEREQQSTPSKSADTDKQAANPTSKARDSRKPTDATESSAPQPSKGQSGSAASGEGSESTANKSRNSRPPATTKPSAGKDEDLLHGLLKEVGNEDYLSPAGLRYTRGGEEGHRLKHLARHLEDQPDRPGKHGVFIGDMPQVLKWLDEAYGRALAGAKGTSKREEDGRTVYEASFSKPIGYIGGRDGARQKNPDSKRLRMVVDDNRLITAFPF